MRLSQPTAQFSTPLITGVAVLFTLVFFTNIPSFLLISGRTVLAPSTWMYAFVAAVVVTTASVWSSVAAARFRRAPLLPLWGMLYLMAVLVWYLAFPETTASSDTLRLQLSSMFFLGLAWVVFVLAAYGDPTLAAIRWTILVAVLLGVLVNIYDITHPLELVPLEAAGANPGRAAGFYVNANQSGGALLVGMVLSIGLFRRYRALYALCVLAGVALTISRAAILGWFLIATVMVFLNVLKVRDIIFGVLLLLLMGSLALQALDDLHSLRLALNAQNIAERLDWFVSFGMIDEAVQQIRLNVARLSWEAFASAPVFGNGLGASLGWEGNIGAHNIYLRLMAEHGIIGILLFPALVACFVVRADERSRGIVFPLAIFLLFWGLFSHNVLEDYVFLLAYAIVDVYLTSSRGTSSRKPLRIGYTAVAPSG